MSDDGKGGADVDAGSGLRGLIDRVETLGGRVEVLSLPSNGTRVSAWIPIPADEPLDEASAPKSSVATNS